MNKPSDADLGRLLTAAGRARAGTEAAATMPPAFPARLQACWRLTVAKSNQAALQGALLILMFRRALVCAAILTLLSVIGSALWQIPSDDDGLDLASYELQSELMP